MKCRQRTPTRSDAWTTVCQARGRNISESWLGLQPHEFLLPAPRMCPVGQTVPPSTPGTPSLPPHSWGRLVLPLSKKGQIMCLGCPHSQALEVPLPEDVILERHPGPRRGSQIDSLEDEKALNILQCLCFFLMSLHGSEESTGQRGTGGPPTVCDPQPGWDLNVEGAEREPPHQTMADWSLGRGIFFPAACD